MHRLSVVITNYNYARFVAEAVESALALDWDDVEVVVVDDGSTDGSLQVLESYADRIRLLAVENSGQRVAANRGFAASTGDVVIFLDADDVLPLELPRRVADVWGPGVSKVQFRVQPIDVGGRPLARAYPEFDPVPTPNDIRRWMTATTAYPTPPGSGNAYARWCLERIFPLDEAIGPAADSACLATAALLGDVVTVPDVLVGYRWHEGQLSDLSSNPQRFTREVAKGRARWRLANRAAGVAEEEIDDTPLFRSRELLQFRVAAHRVDRQAVPPLAGENTRALWRDVVRAPWHDGPEKLLHRMLVTAWCAAVLVAPAPLALSLIRKRYHRNV